MAVLAPLRQTGAAWDNEETAGGFGRRGTEEPKSSRASSIIARLRAAMTRSISATVSVAERTREYFSEPSFLCKLMRDFMA